MLQNSAVTCPYGITRLLDILKASAILAIACLLCLVLYVPGMQHLQVSCLEPEATIMHKLIRCKRILSTEDMR